MPKAILPQPKGWYVYCYLRTHSNRPYYIGVGSRPDRMTARHTCKVPRDWSRIRVMRQGLTRDEALRWEVFYIERYGRKDLGTGFLINRKEGGICGGKLSPETRARLSEHTKNNPPPQPNAEQLQKRATNRMAAVAARHGIPVEQYIAMSKYERDKAKEWCIANPSLPFSDYMPQTMETRQLRTAVARGIPEDIYMSMGKKERNTLRMWLINNPDKTGEDYLAGVRKPKGPSRRVDRDLVLALLGQGLTRVEVAERVGCTPPHVSRISKVGHGLT